MEDFATWINNLAGGTITVPTRAGEHVTKSRAASRHFTADRQIFVFHNDEELFRISDRPCLGASGPLLILEWEMLKIY